MRSFLNNRATRTILAVLGIIACLWGMRLSWRQGMSRLLAVYSRQTLSLNEADRAVRLSPNDAEAYDARAQVLINLNRSGEAIRDLESAVRLRPSDYFLWLELGRARDMADNETGALAALTESVRLAPYYGEPRWQLGNVLYRTGRTEEGLAEIRRAALSDPTFFPLLVDLAWGTYRGDAEAVERAVSPQSNGERLTLARYFVKHEQFERAMILFRAAGNAQADDRRAFMKDLMAALRYLDACEVWKGAGLSGVEKANCEIGNFVDGGFEGRINLRDEGFGWQQSVDVKDVRVILDTDKPRDGAQSLLLEFQGNSNPSLPVLSQVVLVEPGARYALSFGARTEEIVTGGPLMVTVVEPGRAKRVLGKSNSLPQGSSTWSEFTLEFETANDTEAIIVQIQREPCSSAPCPVFGRIWLDGFKLRKL